MPLRVRPLSLLPGMGFSFRRALYRVSPGQGPLLCTGFPGHGGRQRYGDAFRRFVVGLRAEHDPLSLEDLAACVAVPLGTLPGLGTLGFARSESFAGDRQQAVGELLWGLDVVLLTQLKQAEQRLAYGQALFRGGCRNVLVHIELGTVERQGKALTHFEQQRRSHSLSASS